tara:strand:- start:10614 stop:10733 length:120 start_codon:yes stop_codon:yes gene_type:complete
MNVEEMVSSEELWATQELAFIVTEKVTTTTAHGSLKKTI